MSDELKPRPCVVYKSEKDETFCGWLHALGFKAWTHGAAVTVGGFTAGQESYAVGIVEFSDGHIEEVPVAHISLVKEDGE